MLEKWKGLNKYDKIYFYLLILTFIGAIGEFMYYFTLGDPKNSGYGYFLFPAIMAIIMVIYTLYVKHLNQGKWSVMWGIFGNIAITVAAWFIGAFIFSAFLR